MANYFISDLHLQPSREDLFRGYVAFCDKHLSPSDTLYILGDFFDAWIGDDEDGEFYLKVKNQLRALVQSGCPVFFMHGNRDFLIGKQFAADTGIRLLDEYSSVELLSGQTALLLHGDSLCTGDVEYMAFRQQVRSPEWQAQILGLPLEHRRVMAADLRAKSKSMNSNKAEDIMDVSESSVKQAFEEAGVALMIHGHTHRPNRHQTSHDERIVLGDWDEKGWYLIDTEEGLDLVEFTL